MLTAVPPQLAPAESRDTAFERAVTEAITTLNGPDAAAHILRLYRADTAALTAHMNGAVREASAAASDARRHWDMLTQLQAIVSQGLYDRASMAAETSTLREIYAALRDLVHRASGGRLDSTAVAQILSVEPFEPVRVPTVLGFLPSDQYRGGEFRAIEEDVTFVFTFIGWALVDHGPGAHGSLEQMFIVADRAMPRSAVEGERRLTLERMLTNAELAAA